MRWPIAVLLGAVILALSAGRPSSQTPPAGAGLRVLAREGTRTLATVSHNNQEYLALDDVATAFGLTLREDRLAGGVTATAGARSIIVTADQPVVSVAGRLVSLSTAPVRQGARWLVPLEFLQRAVGPALDTRMELRRAARLLVVGDLRVPRVAARVESGSGGTTVVFDSTPPTPARVVLDGGRPVVSFEADALELSLPAVAPNEFLQALQPGDTPSAVRVVPGPRFGVHRASSSQPDATLSRISLELLAAGTDAAPPTPPVAAPPAPSAVDPVLPLPALPPGVRTIVIDAGHGGDETGARGAGGTLEKDIALAVSRRLRTLIESRLGLRVLLTRDDDRSLTLDERSAYANSQKADIFISIHANAALRPTISGAEIYYLNSDAASAEARRVAESSGVVLPTLGGGARAIDMILWETAQSRYLNRSAVLASKIEASLTAAGVPPRPVQQAPFRVLVGANMPAVLVEIGYLSNAEQEKALASAPHQDKIAQALFDAVVQFRTDSERGVLPALLSSPMPLPTAPR